MKQNNENKLKFKVEMTFYESPNFNLTSDGETIELARVCSREAAEMFARAYALEILRHYNVNLGQNHFDKRNDDDFYADFESNDYCVIRWNECISNIFSIIEICPHCGCAPTAEPYALANNTHCPWCGVIFED